MKQRRPQRVAIFSPALDAVSGVATHANMLFGSGLAQRFELMHFQAGREGRPESTLQQLARFACSPLQLAVFILRRKPCIVHINTSMDMRGFWRDLIYLIVSRALGCRVVNQVHSGSGPQSLFSNPLLAWVLRRFLLASHVVAVLSSEAQRSYKAFDARIKVELVPNAIDTASLLEVEREESFDRTPLKLVYMGRIVRSKGLFDALEALKLLKEGGLQFCLRVAGSGPDEAAVRMAIERLGLEREVLMLGPVHGRAKNQLWLTSDVHVFPTFHDEGLPYSILESLAAGCVPVTCSVGGISDVIQDGVQGIYVPAHDPVAVARAVRRLANDRSELRRMSQAGRRKIAEQYTVDRLAARFGEIYERVA